jgi:hypothetical protein
VSLNTNVVIISGDVHRAEVSQATCTLKSDEDAEIAQIEPLHIVELTSSGLSHTLSQRTNGVPATAEELTEAAPSAVTSVPVVGRGIVFSAADTIYQVCYCCCKSV